MIVLLALLMAKDLGPVSGRSPGVSSEENSVAIASRSTPKEGQRQKETPLPIEGKTPSDRAEDGNEAASRNSA
jgi:hypothetical protein